MYAIVKCFGTERKLKFETSKLYNVDVESDQHRYWPFQPKNDKDFKKLKYHGYIFDGRDGRKKMSLVYILFMSESETERDEVFDKGGASLGNPKRRSFFTNAVIELSLFMLVQEADSAAASKIQEVAEKKAVLEEQNELILERALLEQAGDGISETEKKGHEGKPKRKDKKKAEKDETGQVSIEAGDEKTGMSETVSQEGKPKRKDKKKAKKHETAQVSIEAGDEKTLNKPLKKDVDQDLSVSIIKQFHMKHSIPTANTLHGPAENGDDSRTEQEHNKDQAKSEKKNVEDQSKSEREGDKMNTYDKLKKEDEKDDSTKDRDKEKSDKGDAKLKKKRKEEKNNNKEDGDNVDKHNKYEAKHKKEKKKGSNKRESENIEKHDKDEGQYKKKNKKDNRNRDGENIENHDKEHNKNWEDGEKIKKNVNGKAKSEREKEEKDADKTGGDEKMEDSGGNNYVKYAKKSKVKEVLVDKKQGEPAENITEDSCLGHQNETQLANPIPTPNDNYPESNVKGKRILETPDDTVEHASKKQKIFDCETCKDLRDKLTFAVDSMNSMDIELKKQENVNVKLENELQKALNAIQKLKQEKEALAGRTEKEKDNVSHETGRACKLNQLGSKQKAKMVDCGAGIQIDKEKVGEIEIYCDKFTSRVNGLKKLFWGDKRVQLTNRNLSKGASVIPTENITSMRELLNSMAWEEKNIREAYKTAFPKKVIAWDPKQPISEQLLRNQLRKTTKYGLKTKNIKKESSSDSESEPHREREGRSSDSKSDSGEESAEEGRSSGADSSETGSSSDSENDSCESSQ